MNSRTASTSALVKISCCSKLFQKRAACSFLEKFATARYLFPKPKLTSNAVQIKQANTHMNTFKFYKEVQQQIWGEVVEFIPSSSAVYLRGFGSASPKVRYSDLRTSRPVPSQNTKVKEFLKSVYICQSYHQNKSGSFFMAKVKAQTSSRLTVDNLWATNIQLLIHAKI